MNKFSRYLLFSMLFLTATIMVKHNEKLRRSLCILNHIKYFGIQFILFTVIILTGFYSDSYISKPFTYTDLIAIIIHFAILIVVLNGYFKLKEHLMPIHLFNRVILSLLAFVITIIFMGILTGE